MSKLRILPLPGVVPWGDYWGVRKEGTGPGRAGARAELGEVSRCRERTQARGGSVWRREGAVFLAKDSDRQEPKRNKTKRKKRKSARLSCRGEGRAAARG